MVADHKDMVYSFAYYYLGNRQEAEDVTQDVLVRFWRHWQSLEAEVMPRWLNRVTRNRSFDVLRSRTRRVRVMVDEVDETAAERVEATEPGPESSAAAASLQEVIRKAVARLPEPYRSAVILREIQEHSYADVAQTLEIPVNTVKTHVHRGRRMLRAALAESGHG